MRNERENALSSSAGPAGIWPADVIHVNEDGWVLINRGQRHGVPVGLRLLVVGTGARELRDLFSGEHAGNRATDTEQVEQDAEPANDAEEEPVVLRTRRTYELLEVVHVEPACAVAIAARSPAERRPQFYRGPQGELLVWVPLPPTFTYPQPNAQAEDEEDEVAQRDERQDEQPFDQDDQDDQGAMGATGTPVDVPPQRTEQEDERWEAALPLNGVGVGDQVVPAMPVGPAQPTMTNSSSGSAPSSTNATGSTAPSGGSNPFEAGKDYDWTKPQS